MPSSSKSRQFEARARSPVSFQGPGALLKGDQAAGIRNEIAMRANAPNHWPIICLAQNWHQGSDNVRPCLCNFTWNSRQLLAQILKSLEWTSVNAQEKTANGRIGSDHLNQCARSTESLSETSDQIVPLNFDHLTSLSSGSKGLNHRQLFTDLRRSRTYLESGIGKAHDPGDY
jgi:hypothetical protein